MDGIARRQFGNARLAAILALAILALGAVLIAWDPGGWVRPAERGPGEGTSGLPDPLAPARSPTLVGKGAREKAPPPAVEAPLPPPVDLDGVDRTRGILHGVVVTEEGVPIAGARLEVLRFPFRRARILTLGAYYICERGAKTGTATDGSFSIGLRPGVSIQLEASAPGRATARFDGLSAGERVRLVLPESLRLVVTAVDEEGEPVPGTAVRLFRIGGGQGSVDYARGGVTDDEGLLVFEALHGGHEITLDGKHPDRGESGWTRVPLDARGEQHFALTIPRGRSVRGTVTDADTGAPIPGAKVGANWTVAYPVFADEEGRYHYRGWTSGGTSVLTAIAPGYAPAQQEVGDADAIDFSLAPGGVVRGRVLALDGRPIEGAIVGGLSNQKGRNTGPTAKLHARSAADGTFALAGTRRDRGLKFVVIAPDHARHSAEVPVEQTALGDFDLGDIVLEPGRAIVGVLEEADGTPLPRARMYLSRYQGPSRQPRGPRWYGYGDELYTDDLGRFRFTGVGAGAYCLYTRPRGRNEQRMDVVVEADRDTEDVRFALDPVRTIQVIVEDTYGEPIPGINLAGHTMSSRAIGVGGQTDDRGRLTLNASEGVVAIGLRLWGEAAERWVPTSESVQKLTPETKELRFVLAETEPLSGRILDEAGEPVEGLHVKVAGMNHLLAVSDAEGRFRLHVVKGSVVELVVNGFGQKTLENGAVQGYRSDYRGKREGVPAGADDVVIRVKKREHGETPDRCLTPIRCFSTG